MPAFEAINLTETSVIDGDKIKPWQAVREKAINLRKEFSPVKPIELKIQHVFSTSVVETTIETKPESVKSDKKKEASTPIKVAKSETKDSMQPDPKKSSSVIEPNSARDIGSSYSKWVDMLDVEYKSSKTSEIAESGNE